MDLFDPKPELTKRHGKPTRARWKLTSIPRSASFWLRRSPSRNAVGPAWSCPSCCRTPAPIADEITLVRSMVTDSVDHEAALRVIHAGKTFPGRPAWGSWVLYGLGSARQDLPAYVVLCDPGGLPVDGPNNWSSGFLPAVYQGTPSGPRGRRSPTWSRHPICRPRRRRNQLTLPGRAEPQPSAAAPR